MMMTARFGAVTLLTLSLPVAGYAAMTAQERAAILAPTTDFSAAEQGEAYPGGSATNRSRLNLQAFSQPSASLDFEGRMDFFVGNGFFDRPWVIAPSSTVNADGLGPLYNARSCQGCHIKDGRGHPPDGPDDSAVSMFLRISIPPQSDRDQALLASGAAAHIPEPTYGTQIQDLAIPGHVPEGRMAISYEEMPVTLGDGTVAHLRQPIYSLADPGYGPPHPDAMLSPRVAPPMIGLGLLEAIPAADIIARADPDDLDGDGISGRPQQVGEDGVLGRFGWKASNPTLETQSAGANAGDIGISNPLHPFGWGECTTLQTACRAAPTGDDADGFEANAEISALLTFYSRHLAVPARPRAGDADVLRGKALFYQAGCTACHTPKHATGGGDLVLSGELIWPYTDLLLHDMGPGLADGRPSGQANGQEWRTAPLWGIGYTQIVNGHTFFLHDGRARNLTEAILWHGGEAEAAKEAFRELPAEDRAAFLTFLESL